VKIGRSPSFSNRQNGSTVVPGPKKASSSAKSFRRPPHTFHF
jgi:hypothetical protein